MSVWPIYRALDVAMSQEHMQNVLIQILDLTISISEDLPRFQFLYCMLIHPAVRDKNRH